MRPKNRLLTSLALTALVLSSPPAFAADGDRGAAVQCAGKRTLTPASPERLGFSRAGLEELHAAMRKPVADGTMAGGVTMLVRNGCIVDVDVFGQSHVASRAPMMRDTIFRMYSQTKTVTGVALMILHDEGKWSLDDPVTKFIPQFANLKVYAGRNADGSPILQPMKRPPTMRELVSHTAGFGYGLSDDNYADQQFQKLNVLRSRNLDELVERVAQIPLLYQPGESWDYSIAVDLQGYIVQKISGMPFETFMERRIFKPLGMKDTGFWVPPEKVSRLAGFYGLNPETKQLAEIVPNPDYPDFPQDYTKPPATFVSGGGGLVSTIDDWARFSQMLLNGGELGGVRILSRKAASIIGQNQLPPGLEANIQPEFGGKGQHWGVDFAIISDPKRAGWGSPPGTLTWGGLGGTWYWIDPKNNLFFLGMVQRAADVPLEENPIGLSNRLVYRALTKPSK